MKENKSYIFNPMGVCASMGLVVLWTYYVCGNWNTGLHGSVQIRKGNHIVKDAGRLYCGYPEDERYSFTIKSGKMPGECENW